VRYDYDPLRREAEGICFVTGLGHCIYSTTVNVFKGSRGNSVSTASHYGLDYRAIGVRFPEEVREIFL
jgi:hypothetical protein